MLRNFSKVALPLGGVIICNSSAQVAMKMAAQSIVADSIWNVANFWLIVAFVFLGIAFLLWQFLLGKVNLSFLHPFCALTYLFVPCLASLFFDEPITWRYLFGVALLLGGIFLTSTGASKQ